MNLEGERHLALFAGFHFTKAEATGLEQQTFSAQIRNARLCIDRDAWSLVLHGEVHVHALTTLNSPVAVSSVVRDLVAKAKGRSC